LDNSEWSRNGDFAPSRWDSQQDAANIICEAKTQSNPENTLGVMTYAGRRYDHTYLELKNDDNLELTLS
jgi:26S proteasome regulatory subunit N10